MTKNRNMTLCVVACLITLNFSVAMGTRPKFNNVMEAKEKYRGKRMLLLIRRDEDSRLKEELDILCKIGALVKSRVNLANVPAGTQGEIKKARGDGIIQVLFKLEGGETVQLRCCLDEFTASRALVVQKRENFQRIGDLVVQMGFIGWNAGLSWQELAKLDEDAQENIREIASSRNIRYCDLLEDEMQTKYRGSRRLILLYKAARESLDTTGHDAQKQLIYDARIKGLEKQIDDLRSSLIKAGIDYLSAIDEEAEKYVRKFLKIFPDYDNELILKSLESGDNWPAYTEL